MRDFATSTYVLVVLTLGFFANDAYSSDAKFPTGNCSLALLQSEMTPPVSAEALLKNINANLDSDLSVQNTADLKRDIHEYFEPSVRLRSFALENIPESARPLFDKAFAFFLKRKDFRFLDELIADFIKFNKKYANSEAILPNMLESVEMTVPENISFPATAYQNVLPTSSMIIVSKMKSPYNLYVLDVFVHGSYLDTYWDSLWLHEMLQVSSANAPSELPLLSLRYPFDGHSDQYRYFDAVNNGFFTADRSTSLVTGTNEGVNALLLHLSRLNPTDQNLGRIYKMIRAPLELEENLVNADMNNLAHFRLMSTEPLTLKQGDAILRKATKNVFKSIPKLGHRGKRGTWNWILSRFEKDQSKAAILFKGASELELAQVMGFQSAKRKKLIKTLENFFLRYLNDEKSIFTLLRPAHKDQIPSHDSEADAAVVRMMDGFFKSLSKDNSAIYRESPQRMQGWIERKYFEYLFNTGEWPVENFDFETFYQHEFKQFNVPKELLFESLQQYLLTASQKTFLLYYENGLYYLPGTSPNTIRILGLTHNYDDPIKYLQSQNSTNNYALTNLTILANRKKTIVANKDTNPLTGSVRAASPLLFVAEVKLK